MTKKAETMSELREQVLETLAVVKDDRRECLQAHEVGNLAGKVVGMCKVHLERCKVNESKSVGDWEKFIKGKG